MDYVFAAMWLIVGIYLFFYGKKTYKILYLLGGYFVFLAGWWFANAFFPLDLFTGIYVNTLRVISVLVLAVTVIFYIRLKKSTGKSEKKYAETQEKE